MRWSGCCESSGRNRINLNRDLTLSQRKSHFHIVWERPFGVSKILQLLGETPNFPRSTLALIFHENISWLTNQFFSSNYKKMIMEIKHYESKIWAKDGYYLLSKAVLVCNSIERLTMLILWKDKGTLRTSPWLLRFKL